MEFLTVLTLYDKTIMEGGLITHKASCPGQESSQKPVLGEKEKEIDKEVRARKRGSVNGVCEEKIWTAQ